MKSIFKNYTILKNAVSSRFGIKTEKRLQIVAPGLIKRKFDFEAIETRVKNKAFC